MLDLILIALSLVAVLLLISIAMDWEKCKKQAPKLYTLNGVDDCIFVEIPKYNQDAVERIKKDICEKLGCKAVILIKE